VSRARTARLAGALTLAFWALFAANTWIASSRIGITGADVSFVALLLAVCLPIALGLTWHTRWAWWSALALGLIGLFFVLPVAGTILLGGPADPVGTGWDVVFFPLTGAVLIALMAALWKLRSEGP
jgi:hypothetical protein